MIFRKLYYGRPVRYALYAFTETFWTKQFSWKVTIVWIVSEYEWNLMAEWLKLPAKCPVEHFDEKLIFGETSYFWWGIHTEAKNIFGIIGKKLAGLSIKHSSSPMEHVEEKVVYLKKFWGFQ